MPHSHHSHSKDYILHGVDPLESVISRVLDLQFQTYCLTEHIPRLDSKYLYPEEVSAKQDLEFLRKQYKRFLKHASEIKKRVNSDENLRTNILIGMEVESCDLDHVNYAKHLMDNNKEIQFLVGSCHHVEELDIDFDIPTWLKSVKRSGNNIREFFKNYYNAQYEMLKILKPTVVGHFDLVRLFLTASKLSIDKETGDVVETGGVPIEDITDEIMTMWDDVLALIVRNLEFIKSYGGLIEINTSGLRKGLKYPYPHKDVALLAKEHCDSRFVFSDDAHGVSHVATNYAKTLEYVTKDLELEKMYYLGENSETGEIFVEQVSIDNFANDVFWKNLKHEKKN